MVKKTFLRLDSPVQYIKGIGPKRSLLFSKIGVQTVRDLILLVPRRYVDYSMVFNIRDVRENDDVTLIGRIQHVNTRRTRNRASLVTVTLGDATGSIVLKWFNRPDLRKRMTVGDRLIVSGKVTVYGTRQLVNPLYEIVGEEETDQTKQGSIIPIYALTEGLTIWDIRRAIKIAVAECLHEFKETLSESIIAENGLVGLTGALQALHFPESLDEAAAARRRLVYEEFFFFELILARRRAEAGARPGIAFDHRKTLTEPFLQNLPFDLTGSQTEAMSHIVEDMKRPQPMNRLLQGDVGSGKTVVAAYAILVALENDYQAVLMAPTEILAEQHYIVLSEMLAGVGVKPELLTGSTKSKERAVITESIATGEARLILGTHALIEEGISFWKLGLVVVDEQHRFGVMQRAALVNKALNPDFLVLSATPIPRTIALTLYGDLDISMMTEKPQSRGRVTTKIVRESNKASVFEFMRGVLAQGRQAFVICPVIERSETMELKSVKEVTNEMSAAFREFSVEVIHGRLGTAERLAIMNEYRLGRISILVATTVIEVGVDIPNATVMLILHPERFGLAQLHQLRGRIGRGAEESYCFLIMDRYVQPETYERIQFFEKTSDGFALAQKDMRIRGPGEVLGSRQHGLPDINIGDIEYDRDLLFKARDDAFALVKKDQEIDLPENRAIKAHLHKIAERAELLRIG